MAKSELWLVLGKGLSVETLTDALREHCDELESFLIPDLSNKNARATSSPGTFAIDGVDHEGRDRYTVRYQYGWEAYWGCRDMNDGDIEVEETRFRYARGVAVFEKVEIEKRSTFEEY